MYAPTTSHNDEEVETFYEQLQSLVNTVSRHDELFIMGDFNSKAGGIDQPDVVGPHSNTDRGYNSRGEMLVDFCQQNNLFITNTFFKHRRKYTWLSPGDKVRNTVDYILTRSASKYMVIDAHTMSQPDISDHRLVRCKIMLANFFKRKKAPTTQKFNVSRLKSSETAATFAEQADSILTDSDDVQLLMNNIQSALIETSTSVLGKKVNNQNNHWITTETKDDISNKRLIRKDHGVKSIAYKLAKLTVKKLCKIAKQKTIDEEHAELGKLPFNQQYFTVMKHLKISSLKTMKGWAMKDSSGVTLYSEEDILENWAVFYENLYHSNRTTFTALEENMDDPIPLVLISELLKAIEKLKSGKAPGPDALTAEMFKACGPKLLAALLKLINLIISTRNIPEQLIISEIITLFKKGSRLDCTNYRPITLLSHVYKLLMQIIYNQISTQLMSALPRNQAAYQPGRGTTADIAASNRET